MVCLVQKFRLTFFFFRHPDGAKETCLGVFCEDAWVSGSISGSNQPLAFPVAFGPSATTLATRSFLRETQVRTGILVVGEAAPGMLIGHWTFVHLQIRVRKQLSPFPTNQVYFAVGQGPSPEQC